MEGISAAELEAGGKTAVGHTVAESAASPAARRSWPNSLRQH